MLGTLVMDLFCHLIWPPSLIFIFPLQLTPAQLLGDGLGRHSQRHSIYDRSVKTGALLISQFYGYLLGLKSIKGTVS
jgi:hypothetical protein